METKKTSSKSYSPEVKERAVRMVLEHQGEHASQWAAIRSIAEQDRLLRAKPCVTGCVRHERDAGLPARSDDERGAGSASRRSSGRTGSCGKRTRSCGRPRPILPRRSSTAGSSHDRLHRRAPRPPRGRADLPRSADRPVDVSRPRRPMRRSGQAAGTGPARCHSEDGNPARVRGELPRLWRPEGSGDSFSGKGSRSLAAP